MKCDNLLEDSYSRICPRRGHLVCARYRSDDDVTQSRRTGLVVDARGIEVQIIINGILKWVRRSSLDVIGRRGDQ